MTMNRRIAAMIAMPLAALLLNACGDILGNADGAAKLTIKGVTMKDLVTTTETSYLRFFPHEARFDTGRNAIFGDGDEGDDDNFPEPYEVQMPDYPIMSDVITVEVLNEPRLGVQHPVDIEVSRIDFTFRDALGNARPLIMPKHSISVSHRVAPDEAIKFDVEAVPFYYKQNEGGLRDIFLYGMSADNFYGGVLPDEINFASNWKVYMDVYAEDKENGDIIHSQAIVDFVYQNPVPLVGKMDVTSGE